MQQSISLHGSGHTCEPSSAGWWRHILYSAIVLRTANVDAAETHLLDKCACVNFLRYMDLLPIMYLQGTALSGTGEGGKGIEGTALSGTGGSGKKLKSHIKMFTRLQPT